MDEACELGFHECEVAVPEHLMIPICVHLGHHMDGGWRVEGTNAIVLEWLDDE